MKTITQYKCGCGKPSDMLTLTKTFECSRKVRFHTPVPHIVRMEEQNGATVVVTELTEDLQKFLAELKRKNEIQKGKRL